MSSCLLRLDCVQLMLLTHIYVCRRFNYRFCRRNLPEACHTGVDVTKDTSGRSNGRAKIFVIYLSVTLGPGLECWQKHKTPLCMTAMYLARNFCVRPRRRGRAGTLQSGSKAKINPLNKSRNRFTGCYVPSRTDYPDWSTVLQVHRVVIDGGLCTGGVFFFLILGRSLKHTRHIHTYTYVVITCAMVAGSEIIELHFCE